MHENGVAATLLSPIVAAPAATASSSTTAKSATNTAAASKKKQPAVNSKKGAAVTRGKQTVPKAVVAKPVEEVQEEQEEQGNKHRPKKPVLDGEAQRMLRLILSGNQNVSCAALLFVTDVVWFCVQIHFYDTSMKALAEIRAESSKSKEL